MEIKIGDLVRPYDPSDPEWVCPFVGILVKIIEESSNSNYTTWVIYEYGRQIWQTYDEPYWRVEKVCERP
tara:strand:- start:309 stop:518 length:210 start_codon:yes stop_codon:yes gene_type:complete